MNNDQVRAMSRERRATTSALLATTLLLIGCATEPQARQLFSTPDSAGTIIVENSQQSADSLPWWRLTASPQTTIGVAHGDAMHELHDVRSAARLSDGRIVFLNAGTYEVRFFDGRGTFLRSIGRHGRGPGEFRWPMLLARTGGDTIRVYDAGESRVSVIAPNGRFTSMHRLPGRLSGLAGFLDPNIAVTAEPVFGRSSAEGLLDMRTVVRVVDLTTGRSDTIAVTGERREYQTFRGEERRLTPVPYTVHPHTAVGDGRIYTTDGLRAEIRIFDRAGRVVRIHRIDREPEPLNQAKYDDFIEQQLEQANRMKPGSNCAASMAG